MFCPKCGSENGEGAGLCASCGAPLASRPPRPDGARGRRVPAVAVAVASVAALALVGVVAWPTLFSPPLDIDEKNFPDAALRAHVAEALDADGDGRLSCEEGAAVRELALTGATELSGLGRAFPNLTSLTVEGGALTGLDVGDLPRLSALHVAGEPIGSLDLSRNRALSDVRVADSVALSGLAEAGLREEWVMAGAEVRGTNGSGTLDVARDGRGRVVSCRLSKGTGDLSWEFDYDEQGNLVEKREVEGGSLTTRYLYEDGRLASKETSSQLSYSFDEAEHFLYDERGLLVSRTCAPSQASSSAETKIFHYEYDGDGRLVGATCVRGADGLDQRSEGGYRAQVYEGYEAAYDYDGQGRRVRAYTEYDAFDDVDWSEAVEYVRDDDGNVVRAGCEGVLLADGRSRYGLQSVDYAYDDEGRMVFAGASTSDGAYEVGLSYDEGGRLSQIHEVRPRRGQDLTFDLRYARLVVPQDEATSGAGVVLGVAVEPFDEAPANPSLVRLWLACDPTPAPESFSAPGGVLSSGVM